MTATYDETCASVGKVFEQAVGDLVNIGMQPDAALTLLMVQAANLLPNATVRRALASQLDPASVYS